MYTTINFKTKKALKEAVAQGKQVTYFQPGIGVEVIDGEFTCEGPHYPAAHTWYARCVAKDGVIVKVQ